MLPLRSSVLAFGVTRKRSFSVAKATAARSGEDSRCDWNDYLNVRNFVSAPAPETIQ